MLRLLLVIAFLYGNCESRPLQVGLLCAFNDTTVTQFIGWKQTAGAISVAWNKIVGEQLLPGFETLNDTAYMLENGNVCIVGRTKDMIIRGGENVYPTEVEQFIGKQPYVADVQVIGVPDERYGEAVCAWVRLKANFEGKITPDDVIKACKGQIAHYKVPKYVLIKEQKDFPLTATGKVKKFELREISKKILMLENVKYFFEDPSDFDFDFDD